jgi:flagellar basal body-associated protein FliL
MAEIHVQPKKHTTNTSWIWIVLVVLIAAVVIYYLVNRNKTTNNNAAPANTTGAVLHLPAVGTAAYTLGV